MSVRIQYDEAADALYVALKPRTKVDNTLDAGPGVNIDVDAKGNPVGIEVLYAVRRLWSRRAFDAWGSISRAFSGHRCRTGFCRLRKPQERWEFRGSTSRDWRERENSQRRARAAIG